MPSSIRLFAFIASTLVGFASAKPVEGYGKSSKLNILMTNDDGWASANIRATKTALEASGHRVLLVAPLENQSLTGGMIILPTSNVSSTGGVYGLVEPGSSFYGFNASEPSVQYFNGTPAACALWGLSTVAPDYFGGAPVDLVISGPNEGSNLGTFVYSISGTLGAAYNSVMWGTPTISFSQANDTHRPYMAIDGEDDPAVIGAGLAASLVDALASGVDTSKNETVLPLGIGLKVNFPLLNSSCTSPDYIPTRMTGGAITDAIVLNDEGLPEWKEVVRPGLNACVSGDCSLLGEADLLNSGACKSSVTVFSVDYDAPRSVAGPIHHKLTKSLADRANELVTRNFEKRQLRSARRSKTTSVRGEAEDLTRSRDVEKKSVPVQRKRKDL